MFTCLRRFAILVTMIFEAYWFKATPSWPVQVAVYTMVGGSVLAALDDLAFSGSGYALVMANNACTAAAGVLARATAPHLEPSELLLYSAASSLPGVAAWAWLAGGVAEARHWPGWSQPAHALCFGASCVLGGVLAHATILCTRHNSALTTHVIGCVKNIATTYLGVLLGGDYVFSALNLAGINLSVAGSLAYTWLTFKAT